MSSRIPVQENPDAYARPFGGATLLSTPASGSGHLDQPPITSSQPPGSRRTSPNSTTSSTKAIHVCDQCSRAFSRAEHLERHQTTHLPSTATKSFVCPSCGQGFTRKDVLTRHVRAVHETKKSEVRKSRRKSCRRCAAFKIKCTGGGKGKQSGERAAEPCEACRKRDVECIFDFGVTVDKNGSQDQGNPGELFDFGSDDMGSEPETHSSEHSVKRRKTIHHTASSSISTTASMYLTSGNSIASAVSPHLLSAARLASSQTIHAENQDLLLQHEQPEDGNSGSPHLELSSADHLLSMATFANKGMQIPGSDQTFMDQVRASAHPPPLPLGSRRGDTGYGTDFMSQVYFPPIRDPSAQVPSQKLNDGGGGSSNGGGMSMMKCIAEEDLNAANTLQGVTMRPLDMGGMLSRGFGTDYSHTGNNGYSRSHMFGGMSQHPLSQTTQEQNSGSNAGGADHNGNLGPDDPGGLDPVLNLHDEDSFYFDFGIFDNSTDWLRDWGPNDSISPDSQPGIESLEALPEASFNFGPTPGNYNCGGGGGGGGGGEALSLTAVSNARDQHPATPMPVPPEDVAGLTPRPPHISEDGSVLVPGLPTVSPMKDYATSTDFLPWGWQHGLREAPSRKVTLPPLRQVLTERSGDAKNSRYAGQHSPISNDPPAFDEAGTITERMRKDMIDALILPSTHPPYPGCDIAEIERAFPNKEVIAVFIKLYFEQFHPILPVIHRPSFCIERCPSVLLLAMVSIGASYSNLKNSKAFADSLSELCKRYLVWMAESDPTYGRSAFYLQSMCLQNLYAMGSGSTNLYDAADVSRSVLIGNARRIGLFSGAISSPASSSPSSAPNSPALHPVNGRFSPNHDQGYDRHESPLALEARWRDWREKEGLKRLAWGIFEYDSSFSTLSNRRGAITISDITIRLPCSESLWQAATATSWQALLAQEPEIRGFQFYSTLKLIIAGRFDVDTLTSWGKRICAQAMGRIMWDFKELEESVLSVGPFGKTSFKPQKEMMLRSLMLVCESSTPRAGEAEGDRYHWILARLIAHYTHLHAAFPTISLMLGLARKPPRQGAETTDHRIKRLKNLLATDPAGARTLAWHAAQIIALSRWKPVFSPVEGMRLFLAGVVLWGFANYHRSDSMSSCGSSVSSAQSGTYPGRPEDVVRLDLLPWNTPSGCSGKEEEWIRYGRGKATIGIGAAEGDRMMEVCGEDGAKEVLRVVVGILGSLRVWGLGGEFKGVLEELVARKS